MAKAQTKTKADRSPLELLEKYERPGGSTIFTMFPHLTDAGNAERFAYYQKDESCFCDPWKRWLVWNELRWIPDNRNEILKRSKKILRELHHEIGSIRNDVQRAAIASHIAKSESDSKIRAFLHLAQGELPAVPDDFDRLPWELNVENGTIDLQTGERRKHNPGDMITKLANVAHNPDAECPHWLSFLDRIFGGNADLILFLQKAVGYSLTGDTREQCLFILYGSGANGKSTFLHPLRKMLSDYGQQTSIETFMIKRNDQIPNDLAALKGARFVSAVEAEQGRRLAESMVKQLTGGDRIAARFLHQEWFEFEPQFKIFLATNHKPIIRGSDLAIWRRIRLIPFTVTIEPEEQDRELPLKLEAELPGILNWALEGCKEWQESGLEMPEEVKAATDAYRSEMDVMSAFFDDCCCVEKNTMAKASDLYAGFVSWAERSGEYKLKQRAFGMQLTERGFDSIHQRDGNWWLGIGLREENAPCE